MTTTLPTIVFLTAIPPEYEAVRQFVTNPQSQSFEHRTYLVGQYSTAQVQWRVVVRQQSEQGNCQSALEADWAIRGFRPSYLFFVGVAGGIKKDVELGDVVAVTYAKGFERVKINQKGEVLPRFITEHSSDSLQDQARHLAKTNWMAKRAAVAGEQEPNAVVEAVASGEKLVASEEFKQQLLRDCSDTVAVEMEAIGFLRALRQTFDQFQVKGIVIRGISDLIVDKLPGHDEKWQPIAARNAAAFAFAMLDELKMPDRSPEPVSVSPPPAPVFALPFPQNPQFVGREAELQAVQLWLAQKSVVAICGLGGVGKTQLAVQYAYQYQQAYSHVLWVSVAPPLEIQSQFASLAETLGIPIIQQTVENLAAQVKLWLASHSGWLLLLDNIEEEKKTGEEKPRPITEQLQRVLPDTLTGRVLLTTRQAGPPLPIQPVVLQMLTIEEGAKFLVQLVYGVTAAEASGHGEYGQAQVLSQQLGGLPLALTQAAAYMRVQGRGCADYLALYHVYQKELLAERGEKWFKEDHPESVAVTLRASLQQVQAREPQALELLQGCAFLPPDGIPEEVLRAALAVNPLQLDKLLKPILSYSLLTRDPQRQEVSIHRLVQAVLRWELEAVQAQWVERLVTVLETLFPATQDSSKDWAKIEHWQRCERLLSSALACGEESQRLAIATVTLARLLGRVADYLRKKADYEKSLQWYKQALAIWEKEGDKEVAEVVSIRNSMVQVYDLKGDYATALSLAKETLARSEQVLGDKHPQTATSLGWLGMTYYFKGEFENALPLCQRAVAINEEVLGKDHYDTGNSFDRLAVVYQAQGEYEKALPLFQRALAISERVLGTEHPETANSLNNLAQLYQAQGEYEKALPLFQRALEIYERVLGKEHPHTATNLNNLAQLYYDQGEYEKALPPFESLVEIRELVLGKDHPDTAISLNNLAVLYDNQGEYEKALALYQRALEIRERVLGKEHPDTATSLNNLAGLYQAQGEYEKALPLYERALAILNKRLGEQHPTTRTVANNYQDLLKQLAEKQQRAEAKPRVTGLRAWWERVRGWVRSRGE
jgi:tetratricopeptide (TPR) repeat protein/nucleoside phosphorylase